MSSAVTNWMGYDGFRRRLQVQVRRFCFVGDTTWIKGRVIDKRVEAGEHIAELEFWAENHRGEVTTTSRAWVLLPSREGGPVVFPAHVPENVSVFA